MSSPGCNLCSVKSTCPSSTLFLFAPNEILSQRLGSVLTGYSLPFTSRDQTFALAAGENHQQVIDVLRTGLSQPETQDIRIAAEASNPMSATSLAQFSRLVETRWFETALKNDHFAYWYQPIVNVIERSVVAHECLIRLQADRFYSGQEIIDAAVSRGDIHVFDSYSRRTAIRQAAQRHASGKLFVNFMPSSIYDPAFCMASTLLAMSKTHLKPSDIVFEVVESERVSDPRHLRKIIEYYREKGFGVALDDVGTGANSLQMIADIQPDFIKLDKSIVWNYDNPIGRRTIQKLAELGSECGISVIAEGVETEAMQETLRTAGISLMQGYYFAKPAPSMVDGFPASRCWETPKRGYLSHINERDGA